LSRVPSFVLGLRAADVNERWGTTVGTHEQRSRAMFHKARFHRFSMVTTRHKKKP
jgi:hypothetical protein